MERKLTKLDQHTPEVDYYEMSKKIESLEQVIAEQNEVH